MTKLLNEMVYDFNLISKILAVREVEQAEYRPNRVEYLKGKLDQIVYYMIEISVLIGERIVFTKENFTAADNIQASCLQAHFLREGETLCEPHTR